MIIWQNCLSISGCGRSGCGQKRVGPGRGQKRVGPGHGQKRVGLLEEPLVG